MKGLSHDIKLALDTIIDGLDYRFPVKAVEPDELKAAMKSKLSSFESAKKLLHQWKFSPNAPRDYIFKEYAQKIADSGDASLNMLRRALKLKIDYKKVNKTRHYIAVENKVSVLESIITLEASVIELKNMIASGNIVLKEREFKRGFPEKYADGEFFPLSDYYKKWYNEEEDAIVIDPKGSRGPIIVLDDLRIQLPNPPGDKTKILFSDKKKKDQYWRRSPLPDGCVIDNAEMFYEYILEQFRMRREGVWFMNNGTPTYLTGKHWFQLQWGKMFDGDIYPDYREAQRDLAYHKQACLIDTRCMGEIFLKSRQTGYTYGIVSDAIEEATATNNIKVGLTSMTEADAKYAFAKEVYTFQELPFFFQPILKSRPDSVTKLEFGRPSNTTKQAKKEKDITNKGYLNTLTDYQATKEKAYDGQALRFYIGDECFEPDTKILMADMSFKRVRDIKSGDLVMTEGGDPIEVSHLVEGFTKMYEVIQPYGKNYKVTENHRLLVDYGQDKKRTKEINITAGEYQDFSDFKKRMIRRKTFSGVEFEALDFFIPPYIFGVWLGDGYSKSASFIVNPIKDYPIYEQLRVFADSNNFSLIKQQDSTDTYWKLYLRDNNKTNGQNRFTAELKRLGVFRNKHIPVEYKICSKEQRYQLLGGLLDTDGYKSKSNRIEFKMSRENLIKDIYAVSKSCGLDTSEVSKHLSNHQTPYYSVSITDYTASVMNFIPRKTSEPTKIQNRRSRISDIKYIGLKEFCGITLKTSDDKKRKIILEDYTLTMNCAKWGKISYIEHLNTMLPTIYRGGRVTGKCFLGSTFGKLSEGGEDYKTLYYASKVKHRTTSGKTATKLYSYFMPAHKNFEACIDKYGKCWEETPPPGTYNTFGEPILKGSIEQIKNLYAEAAIQGDTALNNAYRQFPMTENHAMRDEADQCVFNLTKLSDQLDYNDNNEIENRDLSRGNFDWKDGVRFSEVVWYPSDNGRFLVWWMPNATDGTLPLRNNVRLRNNRYYPMNEYGCIGVDSYGSYVKGDIKQSNGASHAVSTDNTVGVTPHRFLFEYIDIPATQDIFNEDILKAAWFYGLPILAENNRKDFVKYFYLTQPYSCRGFNLNRVDKLASKLAGDDLLLGGQVMTGPEILSIHENAIRTYIQRYVGTKTEDQYRLDDEMGDMGYMPFQKTLMDWMKFDPSKRTRYDATTSSGLAIIGASRNQYRPIRKKVPSEKTVSLLRKYDISGDIGVPITR